MKPYGFLMTVMLLSGIGSVGASPTTPGWVPIECSARLSELETFNENKGESVADRWRSFERAVRSAPVGSSLYVPKPFPKDRQALLEDFEYAFREVVLGSAPSKEMQAIVQPALEAFEEERLEVEIQRVENWTLNRCGLKSPKPYSHLLRLFDGKNEVGRFVLHNTGLWGGFQPVPQESLDSWILTLPSLEESTLKDLIRVNFDLDLQVRTPQYVAVEGLPWCRLTTPCLAFQAQDRTYLLIGGQVLYRLDTRPSALRSVRAVRNERAESARTGHLAPSLPLENPLLSVGFGWAPGKRIGGDPSALQRQRPE